MEIPFNFIKHDDNGRDEFINEKILHRFEEIVIGKDSPSRELEGIFFPDEKGSYFCLLFNVQSIRSQFHFGSTSLNQRETLENRLAFNEFILDLRHKIKSPVLFFSSLYGLKKLYNEMDITYYSRFNIEFGVQFHVCNKDETDGLVDVFESSHSLFFRRDSVADSHYVSPLTSVVKTYVASLIAKRIAKPASADS